MFFVEKSPLRFTAGGFNGLSTDLFINIIQPFDKIKRRVICSHLSREHLICAGNFPSVRSAIHLNYTVIIFAIYVFMR